MTLLLTTLYAVIMWQPCTILVGSSTCWSWRWDMGRQGGFPSDGECRAWLDRNWYDPAEPNRIKRADYGCMPFDAPRLER